MQGFDVVVVDDGSDESFLQELQQVISRYQDKLPLKLIQKENAYLGASRNTGWRASDRDYILFMDDDNIAHSREVEKFLHAMSHSNADVLTCFNDTFTEFDVELDLPVVNNRVTPIGACVSLGPLFNCYGDSNSFWKRSVLQKLDGFTEDRGIGKDDNEIFARASLQGYAVEVVPEVLFYYRISDDRMRNSQLNPGAGTYRVIQPFVDSSGPELRDLYSLLVGQDETIKRLETELAHVQSTINRSQKRVALVEKLLKQA